MASLRQVVLHQNDFWNISLQPLSLGESLVERGVKRMPANGSAGRLMFCRRTDKPEHQTAYRL